jgi:CBS domain-containing protein
MKVGDVMNRQVIAVRQDAPVLGAATLMLDNKISGLPVLDADGALVGIVSERDLLRGVGDGCGETRPRWLQLLTGGARLVDGADHWRSQKVEQVMTRDPVSIPEDAPLDALARIVELRGFKRIPVTHQGRVVGIVSRADLVRALTRALRRASAMQDPAVRARMVELERQSWTNRMHPPR